jgi:hypothetical protein
MMDVMRSPIEFRWQLLLMQTICAWKMEGYKWRVLITACSRDSARTSVFISCCCSTAQGNFESAASIRYRPLFMLQLLLIRHSS